MSIRLTQLVWNAEINLMPSEHHVLLCLANFANDNKNSVCWPSINTIAKKCHLSRAQTIRTLNNLYASKIITKTKRQSNSNSNSSNIYLINEDTLLGNSSSLPSVNMTLGGCHHETTPSLTMTPNNLNRNFIETKENNIKEKSATSEAQQHLSSVLRSTAKLVIDFLREKTGRNYRYTDTALKPIIQLLKEGVTFGQCKQVIVRKQRDWGSNKEMEKYLRPSTLFRKSNFYDKYLPECITEEEKKKIMKLN